MALDNYFLCFMVCMAWSMVWVFEIDGKETHLDSDWKELPFSTTAVINLVQEALAQFST